MSCYISTFANGAVDSIAATNRRKPSGRKSVFRILLIVAASVVVPQPYARAQNLFFGDIGSFLGNPNYLFTSDIDGGGLTNILPGPGFPVSVDVDRALQRVFWSDQVTAGGAGSWEIRSASFTGSSPAVVVSYPNPGSGKAYGLAVDSVNQQVYWGDGSTIRRANYNGTGAITVATSVWVQAIEVDPLAGKIFWADRGPTSPNIGMANLDGTSPQTLVALSAPALPSGITVDPTTQTVYWSDLIGGTVSSISYLGGPTALIHTGIAAPAGLDLELNLNRLYIVERNAITLSWSLPTGGARTPVFTGTGQTRGEMWDVAAIVGVPEPSSLTLLMAVAAFVLPLLTRARA